MTKDFLYNGILKREKYGSLSQTVMDRSGKLYDGIITPDIDLSNRWYYPRVRG